MTTVLLRTSTRVVVLQCLSFNGISVEFMISVPRDTRVFLVVAYYTATLDDVILQEGKVLQD